MDLVPAYLLLGVDSAIRCVDYARRGSKVRNFLHSSLTSFQLFTKFRKSTFKSVAKNCRNGLI